MGADDAGNGPGSDEPRARSGTAIGGFARLEAATEGIPPNPLVGSVARLERARAWVEEHGGDRTDRERELQAQVLAVLEAVLSGELTLDRFGAVMEFQALELWSKDANGDGELTETEAIASANPLQDAFEDSLLYFAGRFDADGDGAISDDESETANDAFESSVSPMMGTLVDRVLIVQWDDNADGVISDREMAIGHESLGYEADDPRLKDAGADDRYGLYQPLVTGFEHASRFMDPPGAGGGAPDVQEPAPRIPERGDYDFDGDGVFSAVEQQAFNTEQAAWRESADAYANRVRAAGVLDEYGVAVGAMDRDGDGRIADGEWTTGFQDLRQARDARVFLYLYDSDGDGGFGESEVVRFMNAYDTGSIYADADMNGRVDVNDVLVFRDRVMGQ